jgi:carbon storage regulator
MLVLSRHNEESIMIGDDIEVTVVGIRGRNVRLGIEAPRQISVHRREIYDRIRKNPQTAGIGNVGRGNT